MKRASSSDSIQQRALRALPEGAVPDGMDVMRCGLQTVVKHDEHKVR